VALLYSAARYGGGAPVRKEAETLYDLLEALADRSRVYMPAPKFWLYRHVLGWF
jgi:hypothetical protein